MAVSEDGIGPDAGIPGAGPPPHIDESVRRVRRAARETVDSARLTGRALRTLVSADLALARSAFGRAMAWVGIAIVFGASAWLLVTAAVIALLRVSLGWSWMSAMFACAGVSLVVAAVAAWRVMRLFEQTGLHATRRQLSKLGVFDEFEPKIAEDPPPPEPGTVPPPPTDSTIVR